MEWTAANVRPEMWPAAFGLGNELQYYLPASQWAHDAVTMYASRAVQFHPHSGQFDFVWLSARTPHGAYVWCARRNQEKHPPKKHYRSFPSAGTTSSAPRLAIPSLMASLRPTIVFFVVGKCRAIKMN